MNSSTVIKRTLPLIVVLLLIIGIAVSCTVFSKDKVVPSIEDENGVYLSITEGDRTYSISKKEMYDQLKSSVGLNTLLDKIDTDILKSTTKGDSNYWDSVTEDAIDEAIEKAAFPNGKEDLTSEEIDEGMLKYEDSMYTSYGLKTEVEIRDFHRLTLAKRLYAEDQLKKAIDTANQNHEEDESIDPYFTESDYETYYKANYKSGYWTIIVPFKNRVEGENLLKQLGITVKKADASVTGDYDKWVKTVNNEEVVLTPAEVAQVFIDMYNAINSYTVDNYPTNTLTLLEGTQYTKIDNKITFKTLVSETDEALNELYYTNDEISKYQAEIQNFLKVSMTSYNPDATTLPSTKSWYTPNLQTYNNNSLFVYIFKIGEQIAPELDSVKDEIEAALIEKEMTEEFISKEIASMRANKGLVIYDTELEESYIKTVESYDLKHKETKDESKTNVAKLGDVVYSANDLFSLMDKRYGISLATSEINYQRLLNNPNFNMIYDFYNKEGSDRERILDKDKWQKVRDTAVLEKQYFASGAYSQYGFAPTYGWENFLRDYYQVANAEQLLYYFLYTNVMSEYSNSLADLTDLDEESTLWKTYEEKMQGIADEYFNVKGIHLLISVNDELGSPIDPENWTELQHTYAKELYRQIWNYYETETGTSAEKLQRVATLFDESPRFLAGREQTISSQPVIEGINYLVEDENNYRLELAKYKSAGLSVKFEDLGEFQNGKMVKEFDEAVRSIWKANPSTTNHIPYGYTPGSDVYDYLVTEFGYHAYINTSTTDISKWYYSSDTEKANPNVLPTLQMVKTYLKDNSSKYLLDEEGNEIKEEEFTAEMKTAVTTYFTPIKDEIVGSYYTSIELFEQMKEISIDFSLNNYTREDFNKFIDLRIESYQSNLKYFTVEE